LAQRIGDLMQNVFVNKLEGLFKKIMKAMFAWFKKLGGLHGILFKLVMRGLWKLILECVTKKALSKIIHSLKYIYTLFNIFLQ